MLNVTLRVSRDLRDWLKRKAKTESRSMNAQMTELIKEAKKQEEEKKQAS